ncbi:MAG: ArnT family glycosyltransferase [Acidimicrobiales bacterium]
MVTEAPAGQLIGGDGETFPTRRSRAELVARGVVAAAAAVPLVVYLWVALRQLGYPYELEWMEGGSVEVAARVFHGQSIYVAPSLHYVPYAYTPLYYWVSGTLAHVTGIGFLPLRLVSLAASLGCFALLFVMVRRETGDAVAGMLAAGLFAATYEVGGAWLNIGRVDALFLCLLLAAVAVGRRAERWPGALACGLLFFAAFFTKQSGLLAAAPVLVFLVVTRRRVGLIASATVVATVAVSTLVLNATTGGWYLWSIYGELVHQGSDPAHLHRFVAEDLLRPVGFAVCLGLGGLAVGLWRRRTSTDWAYWGVVVAGMAGSAFVSRIHSGGGRDTLIPLYTGVALLAALGYDALRRSELGPPALVGGALALVVALQVGVRVDHPAHLIPKPANPVAGRQLIHQLASTPGEVLVLDHPWYETMAGKPSFAQGEAVHDVLRAGPSRARSLLLASIRQVMATPKVTAVYLDNFGEEQMLGMTRPGSGWVRGGRVFGCFQCFFPPTDWAVRPAFLFVRAPAAVKLGGSVPVVTTYPATPPGRGH